MQSAFCEKLGWLNRCNTLWFYNGSNIKFPYEFLSKDALDSRFRTAMSRQASLTRKDPEQPDLDLKLAGLGAEIGLETFRCPLQPTYFQWLWAHKAVDLIQSLQQRCPALFQVTSWKMNGIRCNAATWGTPKPSQKEGGAYALVTVWKLAAESLPALWTGPVLKLMVSTCYGTSGLYEVHGYNINVDTQLSGKT